MKIFLACSKQCYSKVDSIATGLKKLGHTVIYPNCFSNPGEEATHMSSTLVHRRWKAKMFRESIEHITECDAILVINLTISERTEGYIGGATMLEMYETFRQGKKVFLYNKLPECSYRDELNGLVTKCINGQLSRIY